MTNNYTSSENSCYRHPNRLTAVSCGKCGKPLCEDCINHGPVGIRCIDCLRPSFGRVDTSMHAPTSTDKALWTTLIMVIIFAGIIGKIASMIPVINFSEAEMIINFPGPNLLISLIAGFIIGYVIWRIVGKTWNYSTLRLAIISGVAIPIISAILSIFLNSNPSTLLNILASHNIELINLIIRTVITSLLSGGIAALMATNPRSSGF